MSRLPEPVRPANPNLYRALGWAALGFRIFPVREKDSWENNKLKKRKAPYPGNGLDGAITDPALLTKYWTANPDHLVGVVCGTLANVLDIDTDHDGWKSLEAAGLDDIPETWFQATPSGGEHHVYRGEPGLSPTQDHNRLKGVDRRAGQAYFIAYSDQIPESLDELRPAPNWLREQTAKVEGNWYSGTVSDWLTENNGVVDVTMAGAMQRFPAEDFNGAEMLKRQTEIVKLGAEGHGGATKALDMLKALWLKDPYNTPTYQKRWDDALRGAIRKWGGEPPALIDAETGQLTEAGEDALQEAAAQEAFKLKVKDAGKRLYLSELNGFGLFDADEAFTIAGYKRPYSYQPLIDGVLERGSLGMLYADSFVGKSYLALDWGLQVASGAGYWAGHEVTKGRVLYIAMEGVHSLEPRWKAWSAYHGIDLTAVQDFVIYPKTVDFNSEDSVALLVDYVKTGNFQLTIIDMVKQAIGGAEENSPTDVGAFMNKLAELREAVPGNTVLYLHHSKKDDPWQYRGATPFYGSADFVWAMGRVDMSDKGKADPRRKLVCTKWKNDAGHSPKDIYLEFMEVPGQRDSVLDAGSGGDIYEETLEVIKQEGLLPTSQADFARRVAARTGINVKTAANRISTRLKDGNLPPEAFK